MKTRYLIIAWALGATLALMPHTVHASSESITNLSINAHLDKQDVLDITETITYAFGSATPHEITHDIPLAYTDDQGQRYPVTFHLLSARRDGVEINALQGADQTAAHLHLPPGDAAPSGAETFAPVASHYELHYTLAPAALRGDSGDVLKLTTTGLGWSVPVEHIAFKLDTPGLHPDNFICYMGSSGQASTSCDITQSGTTTAVVSTATLSAGTAFIIYGSFPSRSFTSYLSSYSHPTTWIVPALAAFAFLMLVIGGLIVILIRLRRRRSAPPNPEA